MQLMIDLAPDWALRYIYLLTVDQWRIVGYAFLAVWIVGCAAFAIYCGLRAFGWRRFRGRWYSPQHFEALIQELYTGVREGRVPDYESMRLLDQYIYGRRGSDLRNLTQRDAI